jgi:hypothetical protein
LMMISVVWPETTWCCEQNTMSYELPIRELK